MGNGNRERIELFDGVIALELFVGGEAEMTPFVFRKIGTHISGSGYVRIFWVMGLRRNGTEMRGIRRDNDDIFRLVWCGRKVGFAKWVFGYTKPVVLGMALIF